ncbi:hypothetical protein ACTFIT_009179 [Dictyostelium discoideum]
MDTLFFSVFKNNYLNNIIFKFIRQYNESLLYLTYNFYEFPLEMVIKSRNQILLLEKIKFYNKYIIKGESNDDEVISSSSIITKYYLDFNKECLKSLLVWKELDFETFNIVYNIFNQDFKELLDFKSIYLMLNNGCNYNIFQFIINLIQPPSEEDKKQEKISNFLNLKFFKDKDNFPNKIEKEVTFKMFELLLSIYPNFELPISLINRMITKISIIEKQSNLHMNSLFQLIKSNLSDIDIINICYSSINKAIQMNDKILFSLIIETLSSLLKFIDNQPTLYSLFNGEIKVSNELLAILPISKEALFKSNNLKLFKIIYKCKPNLFKFEHTDRKSIYRVNCPDIANFLISNVYNSFEIKSKQLQFNFSCLNDTIECSSDDNNNNNNNKNEIILNANVNWYGESGLTINKLNQFIKWNVRDINLIGNIDGLNGDTQLFRLFHSNYFKSYSQYLDLLKSSIIHGYEDLVNLILSFSNNHYQIFNDEYNKLSNYQYLRMVFLINGLNNISDNNNNNIMPFLIETSSNYDEVIKLKENFKKLEFSRLPINHLKRFKILNEFQKLEIEIKFKTNNYLENFKLQSFKFLLNYKKMKKEKQLSLLLMQEILYKKKSLVKSNNFLLILILSIHFNYFKLFNENYNNTKSIVIEKLRKKNLELKLYNYIFYNYTDLMSDYNDSINDNLQFYENLNDNVNEEEDNNNNNNNYCDFNFNFNLNNYYGKNNFEINYMGFFYLKENRILSRINQNDILSLIIHQNNSNKFIRYLLGIGNFKYLTFLNCNDANEINQKKNFIHYLLIENSVKRVNQVYTDNDIIKYLVSINYKYQQVEPIEKFKYIMSFNLHDYQLEFTKNVQLFLNFKSNFKIIKNKK